MAATPNANVTPNSSPTSSTPPTALKLPDTSGGGRMSRRGYYLGVAVIMIAVFVGALGLSWNHAREFSRRPQRSIRWQGGDTGRLAAF